MSARLRYYLPTIAVFVGGIAVWEAAVRGLQIQRFLLPAPSEIAGALVGNWEELLAAGRTTLIEALGGFAIGLLAGLAVAFATARFALARGALMPFAIAANAIPIIAFAPIMNSWFGVTSPLSKMMIVAMLVFFPVMINTVRGLTSADASTLELMRSYAASEVEILRKVRVPAALPYFFTAIKVGATLSLIGAVVGEYFGGATVALGRMIVESASFLRFAEAWAAIIIAAALGIGFYLIIIGIERIVMPWHASIRGTG
ncbi:MAG TPA: ABC transporter permease [Candidatus Limnocylindria bacterium]|nr:ABC transporter permease [Candidatus Limnocylindria bacterium]